MIVAKARGEYGIGANWEGLARVESRNRQFFFRTCRWMVRSACCCAWPCREVKALVVDFASAEKGRMEEKYLRALVKVSGVARRQREEMRVGLGLIWGKVKVCVAGCFRSNGRAQ